MNEIVDLIRTIRKQRKELEEKEKQLLSSIRTDKMTVESVYEYFLKSKEISCFESYEQKKMFVFVCTSIVCPLSIGGDRLMPKIRKEISTLTDLKPTRISDILSEVRISYKNYKSFKHEADYLYNSIKRSLTS